jgi:peptidoglycan biosynthesis protein MviN/MurJ (putative lipid II flippase)
MASAQDARVPALIGMGSFLVGSSLNVGGYRNRPLANVMLALAGMLFIYAGWLVVSKRVSGRKRRKLMVRSLRQLFALYVLVSLVALTIGSFGPRWLSWVLLGFTTALGVWLALLFVTGRRHA